MKTAKVVAVAQSKLTFVKPVQTGITKTVVQSGKK